MFSRRRFLRIVHGANPARWAERFGIEPFTHPCTACGAPLTTSVPLFFGQLRGLIAPLCACGHPNPPYCVVRDPRYGGLFTSGGPR